MSSIESLKDAINAAGSDNHEVFGATWTGGYHIQQDPQEFAELVDCLQRNGKPKNKAGYGGFETYLAIGIAAGGNERFICENVEIGLLSWIDDAKHPNHEQWNVNFHMLKPFAGYMHAYNIFWGDSHSFGAAEFLKQTDTQFNLVGIDGDHSPQGVLQDWEMVQPYLAPGCLVWVHDILIDEAGQNGARKLWSRLKTQHEVCLETKGRFGIGVLRVN